MIFILGRGRYHDADVTMQHYCNYFHWNVCFVHYWERWKTFFSNCIVFFQKISYLRLGSDKIFLGVCFNLTRRRLLDHTVCNEKGKNKKSICCWVVISVQMYEFKEVNTTCENSRPCVKRFLMFNSKRFWHILTPAMYFTWKHVKPSKKSQMSVDSESDPFSK